MSASYNAIKFFPRISEIISIKVNDVELLIVTYHHITNMIISVLISSRAAAKQVSVCIIFLTLFRRKLPELERQIQALQQAASDVEKLIDLAKKYTRIIELTPEILHTFVSKIVIHERRERFKQNTEQQIDIYFRYIGNIAGI